MNENLHQNEQPALLKAIELILAKPGDIKKKVHRLIGKYQSRESKIKPETGIYDHMADRLIAEYSNKAAITGGATAFIGIVPGLGTAIEVVGGATADMALCLKFQIEMTMALACLYGHDIENEEEKKKHFIIAGLSTINMEAIRQGGEQAARLFNRLIQRYLQEATFDAIKILFRKVSITLSKKALQKAIPFGIGAIIGFSSNKAITRMVGQRAKAFFASSPGQKMMITPAA